MEQLNCNHTLADNLTNNQEISPPASLTGGLVLQTGTKIPKLRDLLPKKFSNITPLSWGIDTLEVGFEVNEYLIDDLGWQVLADQKALAQSTTYDNEDSPVNFCGWQFMVNRRGGARYNYLLTNGDIRIQINTSAEGGRYFPEVHVKFLSAFLWRDGWQAAVHKVLDWVSTWANVKAIKLSRVDLCADFLGDLPKLDFSTVICKARAKSVPGEISLNEYYQGIERTGYTIGKGEIVFRLYNKTAEIEHSNKEWFKDIWAKNGYKSGTVIRSEFQCRRNMLREMTINTVQDLELCIQDLWRYLTEEWLSIRTRGEQKFRYRWALSKFWQAVQAVRFGVCQGITRLRQVKPTYKALKKMLTGVAVSMTAISCGLYGTAEQATEFMKKEFSNILADGFLPLVEKRRFKLAGV